MTTAGGAKCWGNNGSGQVGDGTKVERDTPVDVSGLTSGVSAIASGSASSHTCALTSDGGVKCWGYNDDGEIGDGTSSEKDVPTDATGVTPLLMSTATFTTTALPAGNRSLQAGYFGDTNHFASTSPNLPQTVRHASTTVGLGAAPGQSLPGQMIRFTATVHVTAPGGGTPTGSVTFKEGSGILGTVALSGGSAVLQTRALAIGSHTVIAYYNGSASYVGSHRGVVVTVDPRIGGEINVNSVFAKTQDEPSVAELFKGGFVVTWESDGQDGSGFGVFARRFNAGGSRVGKEFRVNTDVVGAQSRPSAAGLVNGSFVIVWSSAGEDGSGWGVYGQRYSAVGTPLGAEFRVNTTTAGSQMLPSIAALKSGGFVVAWQSYGQDGSGWGVYGQVFTVSGAKSGAEFKVNTRAAKDQTLASVAALGNGGFVVAWQSDGQDGSGLGVYGQRFNGAGGKAGAEFLVNSDKAGDQSTPAVTSLKDGGFVVVWQSAGEDGSGWGVYGQRYAGNGAKAKGEFLVNTTVAKSQYDPAVTGFPDAGFVVTWTSSAEDGSALGVFGQSFTGGGQPLDAQFRVNTTTLKSQWQSALAPLGGATFVAAWTSVDPDGSLGIDAQRLRR